MLEKFQKEVISVSSRFSDLVDEMSKKMTVFQGIKKEADALLDNYPWLSIEVETIHDQISKQWGEGKEMCLESAIDYIKLVLDTYEKSL